MPTIEPRLGLSLPLTSDDFETAELSQNFQNLLKAPGAFICTSGSRPGSWASGNEGQFIFETDTALLWRWNGSAFVRSGPQGSLGSNRRTTDLTVNTGTYTTVAQQAVTVPAGDRNILLQASWSEVTGGASRMALFVGSTQLMDWKASGDGGSMSWVYLSPAAGSATFAFKVKNTAGTTTVKADSDSPASLDVVEV